MDNDGSLDLVIANQNQGNRVYTNNGSGNFTDFGQDLGLNSSQAVTLGDLNGDGDLSIVVANSGQGNRIYNYVQEEFNLFDNTQ